MVAKFLAMTRPRLLDLRLDNACAVALRTNPSSSAARRMRSRVSGETPGRPFNAKDTAPLETPARAATSEIVGFDATRTSGRR